MTASAAANILQNGIILGCVKSQANACAKSTHSGTQSVDECIADTACISFGNIQHYVCCACSRLNVFAITILRAEFRQRKVIPFRKIVARTCVCVAHTHTRARDIVRNKDLPEDASQEPFDHHILITQQLFEIVWCALCT